MRLDETSESRVCDGGGRACVAWNGIKWSIGAGSGGGDHRRDTVAESLVKERGELRVNGENTIILKLANFEIKALDLAVELRRVCKLDTYAR